MNRPLKGIVVVRAVAERTNAVGLDSGERSSGQDFLRETRNQQSVISGCFTSSLTCSKKGLLKLIYFCGELPRCPPPITDAHLPGRWNSTDAVAVETATWSPLPLVFITTMATSVSAGQQVTSCRLLGVLAYAVAGSASKDFNL